MALLVIATCLGIILGGLGTSDVGWLIGGTCGFVSAYVWLLSRRIQQLERDVKTLQEGGKNKPLALPANSVGTASAPNDSSSIAPVAAESKTTEAEIASAAAVDEKALSLAERLRLHGIDLPEEQTAGENLSGSKAVLPNPALDASTEAHVLPPAASQPQPQPQPKSSSPWHDGRPSVSRGADATVGQQATADKIANYVRDFFTQGNPIVRIGMVVLFFGLSFLLKYAANQGLLPIELRMASVALVATALIGLGWKNRSRAGGYGLVLQGGGIAALYLTIFASAKMYPLMPSELAFGLMAIVVALGGALAVLQNAQVLAVMASAGGFLAPILTSDGSGSHVGLFSFYLLLNLGILGIAWFKAWRLLNWVGFVFTFVISLSWSLVKYDPQFYSSAQIFLIAFFALYLGLAVLFSLKQPPNLRGLVDGSLVFGLPIAAFALQAALLKHTEYGLACSALILAAVYVFLARLLWLKQRETLGLLAESFVALGVCFATLSIPLALSAQWTSAAWALEAAGLVWIGLRQGRLLPRAAGYLLHGAAAIALIPRGLDLGDIAFVTDEVISLLMLCSGAFCIAYLMHRYEDRLRPAEQRLRLPILNLGYFWCLFAGHSQINSSVQGELQYAWMLIFLAISALLYVELGKKSKWPALSSLGYWLLPLTVLWTVRVVGDALAFGYSVHPIQGLNWVGLMLFVLVQYRFLRYCSTQGGSGLQSAYHVLTAWFLFSVGYWEVSYWQSTFEWSSTTMLMVWFGLIATPLAVLLYLSHKPLWPFTVFDKDYKNAIPAPLLLLILTWFVNALRYSGVTDQLYVPLLNPLDLAQAAVIILIAYAMRRHFIGLHQVPVRVRYGSLGLLTFIWINTVMLRAIHHYTEVAYTMSDLWNSTSVQMALSILWTLCALALMNVLRRFQSRDLWMLGAALLGVVLLKLFTKDLTDSGTLARIVSFMVVGGLMLLIGYLSPIPSRLNADRN